MIDNEWKTQILHFGHKVDGFRWMWRCGFIVLWVTAMWTFAFVPCRSTVLLALGHVCSLLSQMKICWDAALRALGWCMELSLACLCSILTILKSFNWNAIFSIDFDVSCYGTSLGTGVEETYNSMMEVLTSSVVVEKYSSMVMEETSLVVEEKYSNKEVVETSRVVVVTCNSKEEYKVEAERVKVVVEICSSMMVEVEKVRVVEETCSRCGGDDEGGGGDYSSMVVEEMVKVVAETCTHTVEVEKVRVVEETYRHKGGGEGEGGGGDLYSYGGGGEGEGGGGDLYKYDGGGEGEGGGGDMVVVEKVRVEVVTCIHKLVVETEKVVVVTYTHKVVEERSRCKGQQRPYLKLPKWPMPLVVVATADPLWRGRCRVSSFCRRKASLTPPNVWTLNAFPLA
ncbi:hypothetical protein BUALT_Bualt05G0030400 [Buddleja alternifolia]|uniref:Uncharacterized protein n=1 Tax=Buddleja alternifolia TaxID=168488 RepID=A0AAV6XKB4_9LAMI|nr:hypothetical protein BUALT_Bualt05G0030400 [Buddleja alternifolia]